MVDTLFITVLEMHVGLPPPVPVGVDEARHEVDAIVVTEPANVVTLDEKEVDTELLVIVVNCVDVAEETQISDIFFCQRPGYFKRALARF